MSTGVQTAVARFVWHDHVSGDVEKAKAFYTALLGWEIETWKPGEMNYPMITVEGKMHGGFGPAQGAPSHWLGHVAVDDADAAAKRAEQAGGKVAAPPMDIPDVGRMAVIQDPQGATLSAFAAASEATPVSEGVFVWDELLTTDVEDAKRFYGEVFGWTSHEFESLPEAPPYTLFRSGDADRAGCMAMPDEAKAMGARPHWIPYIGVDDVDGTTARAKELGATIYMDGTDIPTVGRIAVFGDPTGADAGLFRPSEPS
jgi:predicted enzyme related to lactoylglutathione lyase